MQPVAHLKIVPKGHISVKELAARYGVSKSTLYELIQSDPTFPYKNVGVKKRLVIDAAEFESWLTARTQRQKEEAFNLPTVDELLRKRRK